MNGMIINRLQCCYVIKDRLARGQVEHKVNQMLISFLC